MQGLAGARRWLRTLGHHVKTSRLLLLFVALVACTNPTMHEALLGTWHTEARGAKGEALAVTETFYADGTFDGFADVNGRRYWNFKGKWSVSRKLLYTEYTASDVAAIPVGSKDTDRIIEVSSAYHILENVASGKVHKFVRVLTK